MTHMSPRRALVPNPHAPCAECTRITDARHAAERSGDWARAELLRRDSLKHAEAHRG
ncbi:MULTISPECIES: hypothetical protein [Streptomyces]|uniref:hypothetical protein n=1 Tax=Streptomyces TaxID=1883 RepID=UPI00163B6469|nr:MULTISPECIES: hypothetical protein [Streptomyces]MBC2873623.1 hypothetical protein [Streptomyces sp. TYQ1024]UBI41380.1 hypothetical protein K7I03_16665 [Streptomyces mobaraensis]UKW33877.1 hypothetical protein MCU78_16630 [Streptomyces sp. TYQ1024]